MARPKKSLPSVITDDMFISAIKKRGAWINEIAQELQISPYMVKEAILKNKKLREAFTDVKDQVLDSIEGALVKKALGPKGDGSDGNLLAIMFYLKCQGKERGWIDTPQKKEQGTEDKPIHIKIVGLGGNTPKMGKAEVVADIPALKEKNEEDDIITVDYTEDEAKEFYNGG